MDEDFKFRVKLALEQAEKITRRTSPGPWEASDSGHISDREGFVVCHLTARRGALRWDWERNPNAAFIAQSRQLIPQLTELLKELVEDD